MAGITRRKITSNQIRDLREDGVAMMDIALEAGISRQRVHQIIHPEQVQHTSVLSPRLAETIPLLVAGKTDREIGMILGISLHGADGLVRRLRELFGVHRREQVVAEAFRRGLVK